MSWPNQPLQMTGPLAVVRSTMLLSGPASELQRSAAEMYRALPWSVVRWR